MLRDEISCRAGLFKRLGYEKKYAVRRIRRKLEWEFEMRKLPDVFKEVERIVGKVYGR